MIIYNIFLLSEVSITYNIMISFAQTESSNSLSLQDKHIYKLTLVLLRVFPKHTFLRGVVATPLWIINTEGHITLNLLPVYRYGHSLSIDTKISTNH